MPQPVTWGPADGGGADNLPSGPAAEMAP